MTIIRPGAVIGMCRPLDVAAIDNGGQQVAGELGRQDRRDVSVTDALPKLAKLSAALPAR